MNDFFLLHLRTQSASHFLFKISVVYADVFIPIFFKSFEVLNSQGFFELLCWHRKKNAKRFGVVRWLELIIANNFFITKKTELRQTILVLIRVVDCSNFPSFVGNGPLVVFPDVNVILFKNFAFKLEEEAIGFLSCFTNKLIFEIELGSECFIKLFGPFFLDVQFNEKITLHHVTYLSSVFVVNVFL